MIADQFGRSFNQSGYEAARSPLFRIRLQFPPEMEIAHLLVMIFRRGWTVLPEKRARAIISSGVNLLRHAKGILCYAPIVIAHPGDRNCQAESNRISDSGDHRSLFPCDCL